MALYPLMVLIWSFFFGEKVNEKIGYCKRDRDRVNLSMTPIRVYDPFRFIDSPSRCSSWFWENFLSLIDCLIIPKREGRIMGDFGVEILLLTVSEVLEIVEDE